ncbi:putative oxidoreductase C terminal-domain containing protein [Rhodotorula toruloides]|uniref:Putative oxidoreductase C terminal-domain containing protein n=1 Tax=Rhodotorula toruloides TaxID=5286 RepID=A0A2S9ZZR2_RHOTO|nr:putative oxidoreductase C terminal-domain containing protein [Rhodotorula toruloides]PRQ71258.1 putative oxidoreductase C terminal-domain containing protein [Rhodotorula toruloides]
MPGSFGETQQGRRRSSVRRPSIATTRLGPLTHHKKPEPGAPFKIIFVGAGNINFGSDEGPWDHSFRLENKLGPRLKVVAIIDPNETVAKQRLDVKRSSFVEMAYRDTRICSSLDDFVSTMKEHERPHAFVVGSPAAFRGSTKQGRDFEMQVLKHFPKDTPAMFIEKPLSADSVDEALTVAKALVDSKAVVSVGYFLRYLRVVQKMRQIIEDNELEVMATNARYVCSYANIAKPAWWMKSKDCGPIVEQATHFIDLSRYFGGDVDMDSVQAHALEWDEPAGQLSAVPVDESSIAPDDRIPRVTSATWKYENGAVGSLTHALVLQGYKYSCELDVLCDGYQLKLIDPYNAPELRVRTPEGDDEQVYTFERDDPYLSELAAWVDECPGGPSDDSALADDSEFSILSSFEDASKTYALSWTIRQISEANTKRFKKKEKKADA